MLSKYIAESIVEGQCDRNVLQSVVIDSAMHLLKINLPNIGSVAMSLNDIIVNRSLSLLKCLTADQYGSKDMLHTLSIQLV